MTERSTCLMVHKGPGRLPDDVCTMLIKTASELYRNDVSVKYLVHDTVNARVATSRERIDVAGNTFILFHAQVECVSGTYMVNLAIHVEELCRRTSLDVMPESMPRGQWEDLPPPTAIPRLMSFTGM